MTPWWTDYIDDPAFEQWLAEQFGRTAPGANQDDLADDSDASPAALQRELDALDGGI